MSGALIDDRAGLVTSPSVNQTLNLSPEHISSSARLGRHRNHLCFPGMALNPFNEHK